MMGATTWMNATAKAMVTMNVKRQSGEAWRSYPAIRGQTTDQENG